MVPRTAKADEDGYRAFFESSYDGMVKLDRGGRVCDVNASAMRLLARKEKDLVGLNFEEIFDPVHQKFAESREEWRSSGRFDGELLVSRSGGACFTAEVSIYLGGAGGSVVFRSVGERESFSAVIGEGEPHFRALVNGAPDLVALVEADGNIAYISPSVERMCGFTPEEVEGRSLFEFVHKEDHASAARDLAWTASNPGTVGLAGPVVRIRHRDGSWRIVEAFVSNHMEDPNIGAMLFDCRDITERVRLEEELRKIEERFRGLVEHTHDFIALASAENIALYANPSIERIMGYTPEEFVGTFIGQYIHPDDMEAGLANVAGSLASPGPHTLETLRYVHKDGSSVWLEVTVNNQLDNPAVGGVICNCRDVTERVEAEEKLKEAEERYRLLVEQVPAATYIERNDSESSTVYVSPRIEEMLGYAPEEWTGEPGLRLGTLHPEDHGRVLARHLGCNESGEPFDEEYRCIAKDGREVWVRDEAVLVRDGSGEPLYWQGVKTDITGRKLAELEILRLNTELRTELSGYTGQLKTAIERLKDAEQFLKAREEQLHATFERAAVGIAHVSPEGRWLRVNQKLAAMLGYERGYLIGRKFQDVTHPEDLDADLAQMRRLLAAEIPNYSLEKRYVRRDGSVLWGGLTVSLVRDRDDEPDYFIAVVEDIDRRKFAEGIISTLTVREVEILGLMARGRTNAEIASELKYSINTIKAHVRDITRKLGVGDRTQAAVYAAENGILMSDQG